MKRNTLSFTEKYHGTQKLGVEGVGKALSAQLPQVYKIPPRAFSRVSLVVLKSNSISNIVYYLSKMFLQLLDLSTETIKSVVYHIAYVVTLGYTTLPVIRYFYPSSSISASKFSLWLS